jgi:methyltransferase (TIGR00027 family)
MQISREGCVLHLTGHVNDATPGGALRIEVTSLGELHQELADKHYEHAMPGVETTPWRAREMTLRDPFGNRLVFWESMFRPDPTVVATIDEKMTPVGATSRWVAANRALETESANPIYRDPFARELAGEAGFSMMTMMRAALGVPDTPSPDPYLTIRTRFLDDALLGATADSSITQVVILAAGMDTRAFRLDWPAGTTVFEVDRDDVLEHKEAVLTRLAAAPRSVRRVVSADLAKSWTAALIGAGFDASRPAAILAEGLLMYLNEASATSLIETVSSLARPGSWLGFDAVNKAMLTSAFTQLYMKKLADVGCPWEFGIDDPESWLAGYGWKARITRPGSADANFSRWPFPMQTVMPPAAPRAYYVTARRQDG